MLRCLALAVLLFAPLHAAMAAPCAAGQAVEPQKAALQSPVYRFMQARLGSPTCRAEVTGDQVTLRFAFARGGVLTTTNDGTIEASSLEAGLPPGLLDHPAATRLLQATERSFAPPNGCGIAWAKLARPATPLADQVLEGTACNCRAHLHEGADRRVSLGLSLAC